METTGRQFVSLNQTPDVNFFLCRQCRTHIALTQELVYRSPRYCAGVFGDAVNVQVDGPDLYHQMPNSNYTKADVFCTRCNSKLRLQLIEVVEFNAILIPGRFALFFNKLLKWDGNRIVYADTNEPFEKVDLLRQQQLHHHRQELRHQQQQQELMSKRDFSQLTSFLEVDHSFFTPWNNPNLSVPDKGKVSKPNSPRKQRMNFEPGSFFAYEVHDLMKLKQQPDP